MIIYHPWYKTSVLTYNNFPELKISICLVVSEILNFWGGGRVTLKQRLLNKVVKLERYMGTTNLYSLSALPENAINCYGETGWFDLT